MSHKKNKKIGDTEHIGNIPKLQGNLLWGIDKCPFWLAFLMLFFFT